MSGDRTSARFVFSHPAHFIAFGFGAGLAPFAPGTFGTLLALPLWWLIRGWASPLAVLSIVAFFFAIGVWACDVAGERLGVPDHGGMVWDETVAFLFVLAVIPDRFDWQVWAFFVFRALDILKPPPIGPIERRLRGGFGVMFDDIVAAGGTLLILALAKRILL